MKLTERQVDVRDPRIDHDAGVGVERPPDPALASWANFTVRVDSVFIGASVAGWDGYDNRTHRYDPAYINPRAYDLILDASLGLHLNQPRPVARMAGLGDQVPRTVEEFLDSVQDIDQWEDPRGGGRPAGPPLVPENLVAFRWTIRSADQSFSNSQLIMRPVTPMHVATFRVPSQGAYQVTLQVTFQDGTSGERTVQLDLREWFIVSIGDSLASGQGNPDQKGSVSSPGGDIVCNTTTIFGAVDLVPPMLNEPFWIEPMAHRSMKSGPALAALAMRNQTAGTRTSGPSGRQVNSLTLDKIVFASFARSGAEVVAGLFEPQGGPNIMGAQLPDFIGVGQLEECRRTAAGRKIDALMISIGGNDAGFAGVLTDLVVRDSIFKGGKDAKERREVEDRLDKILTEDLPKKYDELRDQIEGLRREIGVGEVYWSGYTPHLFENRNADGRLVFKACGVFSGPDLDIDSADYRLIKSRGRDLNALIRRKASEFGWHYVDVEADFRGHGYCESADQTYWVGMEESCRGQLDFMGTMHPNFRGHAAYALRLSRSMRRHTFGLGNSPRAVTRPRVAEQPS